MRPALPFLLFAITACAGPAEDNAAAEAEEAPLPAPSTIVGEWRVAGINGEPLDADFGIALSVTSDTLTFSPRCARAIWSYEYTGGTLLTERFPPVPTAIPEFPCNEVQERLATALNAAAKVDRTPENGVLLSGGGHSVTLFSQ